MAMKPRDQVAALPFVPFKKRIKIILITSRATGRWIIPKGWPDPARSAHKQAAREAYEEAGLMGIAGRRSLGNYRYLKLLEDGSSIPCKVAIFPLLVTKQVHSWPEKGERQARMVKPADAARMVEEDDLSKLLREFKPPAYLLRKIA